ncbi:MAG: aldehyde dehydrogenase family protein [Betaproteobacteria bacterium]|nr:aldehyde dehydrogenase family protein [Betaproteobacteria bacterium]
MSEIASRAAALLNELGVRLLPPARGATVIAVRSPIDGALVAELPLEEDGWVDEAARRARSAFARWAGVPAPQRGELVRVLGEVLREHKPALAALVSIEAGKIPSEAAGEVQEMIDICDFAVGLSRQLHGLTIASERPAHRMMEQWLPLGPVGVITAFNFPVAVWSWNAALALVCGNPVIWKPSEKTPLTALAVRELFGLACGRYAATRGADAAERAMLADLVQVGLGRAPMGRAIAEHREIALVSATGSTRMGLDLAPRVAARLGRSLLELGGNNAVIVAPSADLDLALRGLVFGAWGTAGQRCTTTRRLIVHHSVRERLLEALERARRSLPVGSPFDPGTLVGPLVDGQAFEAMQSALARARSEGATVTGGERRLADRFPQAWYAEPALVRMPAHTDVVREETFAPILYAIGYDSIDEAIALNNDVPQGLSSSIFTRDLQEAERFLSAGGSDCGIANVNLGTSGAEIGGAFGGDKQTGGGRESGSDAWKAYMRRTTNTINYGSTLPLAQGVVFDIGSG